ncbi:MAG TPA: DUF6655 family protein [Verrucomicrobiae bacterium]|nr:DUF6655 family protein [Verrucomicrobiae bacterium]
MRKHAKILSAVTSLIVIGFLSTSCTSNKNTETARSATEQLLLSTAADHALRSANLELFAHQKVFLDTSYFDSYDSKYVIGTIRDALSRAGAILEDNAAGSDIIVEARSGALAIDSSETLFGIPTFTAPVPLTGTLQVPEIAFYKSSKEDSIAKIALLAYAKGSREHIYSSGSLDGASHDRAYRCLFIAWIRTDLPEKTKDAKKAQKLQTWYPQYDETHLPAMNAPETATNSPAAVGGQSTTNTPAEPSTNSVATPKTVN